MSSTYLEPHASTKVCVAASDQQSSRAGKTGVRADIDAGLRIGGGGNASSLLSVQGGGGDGDGDGDEEGEFLMEKGGATRSSSSDIVREREAAATPADGK